MLLGMAVAALSVAALTPPISAGVFLLPMITFGVSGGLVATIPAVLVGDVSHGRNERIIALFSMVSDLGAIVGPLVMGWLGHRQRLLRQPGARERPRLRQLRAEQAPGHGRRL